MDKKILYPQKTECVLNIENIQLKLLIDKSSDQTDGNLMMPVSSNTYANHTTHRHAHVEIFCCPEGSFSINTENSIIHLYTGDIAIIPIGLAHNMLPVLKKECWAAIGFQYTFKKRKTVRIYIQYYSKSKN